MATFDQPPKGPVIGPMKEFKDLSPDKKEQLGDLEALGAEVMKPAVLDPAVIAEEEKIKQMAAAPELPTEAPASPSKTPEEVADELEAMQTVLEESDEDDDDIENAATPTEDDKREFLRCILGDRTYAKEYPVFGGTVVLKMRDIPAKLEDGIYSQLIAEQTDGSIKYQSDWDIMLTRYRAAFGLASMWQQGQQLQEYELLADFPSPANLLHVLFRVTNFKNSTMYRVLIHVTHVFRRHLEILMEAALRSDFWKVGGLNLPSEPTPPEPLIIKRRRGRPPKQKSQ